MNFQYRCYQTVFITPRKNLEMAMTEIGVSMLFRSPQFFLVEEKEKFSLRIHQIEHSAHSNRMLVEIFLMEGYLREAFDQIAFLNSMKDFPGSQQEEFYLLQCQAVRLIEHSIRLSLYQDENSFKQGELNYLRLVGRVYAYLDEYCSFDK